LAGVRARTVRAAVIIDAGGRSSRLLRCWAGRRQQHDRLLCAWTSAPLLGPAASITYVESAPDGWWYTAPLPTGRRLLAFHTDADLGARAKLIDVLDAGPATSTLRASVADADLAAAGPVRVCAAGGGRPVDLAGDGWLTVGDASMSFDPLSSQGLFHALYTGQRSARAVLRMLDGKPAAGDYAAELEPVWAAYLANRAAYYGQERRWIDQPFWLRRAGDFSPHRGGRTPMTCHRPRPAGSA
jgi:flavin-dependent dehydrogenase